MIKAFFTVAFAVAALAATPARASDARVQIQNISSRDILSVYMSRSSMTKWGPDLLGEEMLATGWETGLLQPTGGRSGDCTYDLKVVFADGESLVEEDFDACQALNVRVHDGALDIVDADEADNDAYADFGNAGEPAAVEQPDYI